MELKHPITLFFTLFILGSMSSCDKVEDPYVEEPGGEDNVEGCPELTLPQDYPLTRNVLVEDFTGHTCGNCPNAALEAEQLKQQHGDQILIAGVHSGYFAETQNDTGKYSTDFTTEAGENYNSHWSIDNQGLPQGMINRESWNNDKVLGPSEWSNAVDTIIGDSVDVTLRLAVAYDEANDQVCIDVATRFLEPMLDTLATTVYLLEDSIIDWQKNYDPGGDPSYPPGDVENFRHDHVLRAVVNGTWGETVLEGSADAGEEELRSYTQGLEDGWRPNQLTVIAYVYDQERENILQVVGEKVPYDP